MSAQGGIGIHPIHAASKIHFVLSARDLPSRIRGSTGVSTVPDPFVKVWHKDSTVGVWIELTKTKHVINSVNPDWLEVISFDWRRQTGQVWRVEVFDYDVVSKDELLGAAEIDVDNFVLNKNKELAVKLANGGSVFIKKTNPIRFQLKVEHLPKLDTGSGSDPFVECFWSFGKDGETHLFHKTKTIDDAQNAKWEEIISFDSYQAGTNQYFTFKVSDEDTLKDDVIGSVSFEIDSYLKQTKVAVHRLNEAKNKATITVTPVLN